MGRWVGGSLAHTRTPHSAVRAHTIVSRPRQRRVGSHTSLSVCRRSRGLRGAESRRRTLRREARTSGAGRRWREEPRPGASARARPNAPSDSDGSESGVEARTEVDEARPSGIRGASRGVPRDKGSNGDLNEQVLGGVLSTSPTRLVTSHGYSEKGIDVFVSPALVLLPTSRKQQRMQALRKCSSHTLVILVRPRK